MKRYFIVSAITLAVTATCLSFTTSHACRRPNLLRLKGGARIHSKLLTCHQATGGGVQNMNPRLVKTKWVLGIRRN